MDIANPNLLLALVLFMYFLVRFCFCESKSVPVCVVIVTVASGIVPFQISYHVLIAFSASIADF